MTSSKQRHLHCAKVSAGRSLAVWASLGPTILLVNYSVKLQVSLTTMTMSLALLLARKKVNTTKILKVKINKF